MPLLLGLAVLSAALAGALAVAERRVTVPHCRPQRMGRRPRRPGRGGGRRDLAEGGLACARRAARVERRRTLRRRWSPARSATACSTSPPTGASRLWHTSWDAFRAHPLAGTGGGTFWQLWAASPRQTFATLEGHSAYFETLAELGVVGLALLLALLFPPLAAAVRARRTPLVPFVLAAFVGWLAHAGVDWDWELMGVTGAALLCGVALVAAARRERRELPRGVACRGRGRRDGAGTALDRERRLRAAPRLRHRRLSAPAPMRGLSGKRARRARSRRGRSMRSTCSPRRRATSATTPTALATRRRIVQRDPNSWSAWLNLAVAASGAERATQRHRRFG